MYSSIIFQISDFETPFLFGTVSIISWVFSQEGTTSMQAHLRSQLKKLVACCFHTFQRVSKVPVFLVIVLYTQAGRCLKCSKTKPFAFFRLHFSENPRTELLVLAVAAWIGGITPIARHSGGSFRCDSRG